MRSVKRRIFTTMLACFLACMMFAVPVMAATGSYSRTTTKLNAMSGGISNTSKVSSGSVLGTDQSISDVKLYLNVSSGSDAFVVYLKSPEGKQISMISGGTSGTYYFDDFDGEDPYGKWEIYIRNQGTCYHTPQTIPVSTVTATLTVSYDY